MFELRPSFLFPSGLDFRIDFGLTAAAAAANLADRGRQRMQTEIYVGL